MTLLRSLFRKRLFQRPVPIEALPAVRALDCMQFEDRTLFSATPALAAEVLVNTDTTGAQQTHVETQQAVAADASGNFVVAWTSDGQDGSGNGVYAQRFDSAGNKIGGEIQVNSTTTNEQLHASVAVDATGNFVVAWESLSQDGAGYGIFAQRFDSSGNTVGGEFQVNSTTFSDQRNPSVAMDAAGNFVITWSSFGQDGSGYGIYGQHYDSSGAAQGTEFQVSTATTGDQDYSSVAFAGTGDFLVTWTGQDIDGTGIFAQRFDSSGNAIGGEFQVNTNTTDSQIYSSVAADSAGNFIIAWASDLQDGGGYGIYAQRFDSSGVAQGSEFQVNVMTTGDQSAPRVAMAANGSFVVSWTSSGQDVAGTDGVYFRQYDSAGVALTNETLANSTTSGDQRFSSVAMQSNDSFVVVWNGAGSGDTQGVFAQLYVDGANLAPVNTVPGAQSTPEDTALVFSSGNSNQLSVADADSHSNPLGVTLTATAGTVTLGSSAGITFTAGDGTDDLTMTFSGTAANINAALNGLTFTPGTNFVGAASVAITTNDLGYSGTGGAKSTTDNIAITVTAVNDAPVNSIPGVQSTLPNTSIVFSSANSSQISISDVDAASSTVRVTMAATSGTLTLGGIAGLSFTVGDGTSDGTMTFTGNLTSINNALTTVTYTPAAGFNGTATITITTNDLGNTGAGGAQSTSNIITVNVGATIALWFSTEGDVSDGEVPNLPAWKDGAILQLSDPNLAFEPGSTSGTMSQVVNFDTLGNDGNVDIDAIQYVSRTVVIGAGGNTITLQEGDLLLSTKDSENFTSLNSLSVTKDEVFLYRPNAAGNYSSGTFLMVLDNFTAIHGGGDTWALALVESDTLVGDTVLTAGSFLFSRSGGAEDNDIYLFTPTAVGAGTTTGSVSVLIEGDDLQINPKIFGLELIESDTVIGDLTLLTGQILMSIDADDSSVGTNSIGISKEDVFILNVSQTTLISGTASASATLLYQGADLNMDDGGENIDALTLIASHQPPIVSLPSGALAYTENDAATVLDSGATITDPYSSDYDSGNLTLSFTAGGTADDRLTIRNQGTGAGQIGVSGPNITYGGTVIGTYTGGTDGSTPLIITFNANATPTAAQELLRSITYRNVSDAPSTTLRTVQFALADGDGVSSNTVTKTISLTAVNDAPINTVPGAQTTPEDTTLVFSSGNGNQISLADVDAGSGTMQVTLTATNGTITLSGISGLSFVTGTGSGDATMTFTGTIANINAALNGLSFAPTQNYNGAASLQILTSDLGNTGSGGAQSDTDSVAITVTAVNDAPINTVPGAQTTAEDTTLVFSSGNGNQISIADIDAGSSAVQVTLTATNGVMTLSGVSGLSFVTGTGTGDATMTFSGTIANINAALNGLSFTPTANYNGAASLQITMNDLGNTGSGGPLSDSDTVAITVAAVNDAPVLALPGPTTTPFRAPVTFSGSQLNIVDVDAASGLLQLTITPHNGTITLAQTFGLTFSAGVGTNDALLIVQGTLGDLNAALDGATFTPTATYRGSTTIDLAVSDMGNTGSGGAQQAIGQIAIDVAPAAQRFSLTAPADAAADSFIATFSSSAGSAILFADVYAENPTLTVTISASTGTLSLADTSGLTFVAGANGGSSMTVTGSMSNINAAFEGARFSFEESAATLTITASDPARDGTGPQTISGSITITQPVVFPSPTTTITVVETTTGTTTRSVVVNVDAAVSFTATVAVGAIPSPSANAAAFHPLAGPLTGLQPTDGFDMNSEKSPPTLLPIIDESQSQSGIFDQLSPRELKRLMPKAEMTAARQTGLDVLLPWSKIVVTSKESSAEEFDDALIAGTAGVTAALSVGYVLWSLRAASLISTFLASMPAWQAFDPLPVLDFEKRRREDDLDLLDDSDDALFRNENVV